MKNVTISMDEATLRRVRVQAAHAGLSVSRWIAGVVRDRLGDQDQKAAASARIERLLSDFPGIPLSENGKITIDRDEMYGERFRRFDHPALSAGPDDADEDQAIGGVAESPAGSGPADDEPSGSE
jgi:hypothetical protein